DARSPFRRKMRHLVQSKISTSGTIAQVHTRQAIQKTHELGRFVPRITNQPFVGTFTRKHDLLTIAMHALCQFEQSATRSIDDWRLGRLDEFRITVERFEITIVLHDRWLRPDVARGKTGRAQFIELGFTDPHSISIDCWPF